MQKVRIFLSSSFNPWLNLATEDYIFQEMDPNVPVLFLWRNSETVVIGRHQNPWIECHLEKMEQAGVKLARRQSGGGAVFHDLGNTNFTLMNGKNEFSKERNNQILCAALKRLGVDAFASGRNDLMVSFSDGDRKISGSAYKENNLRAFHHGTMLLNVDLTKLGNYLNPSKKKLEAKGVASVRARVANLVEINPSITHQSFCEALISEFKNHYGAQEAEVETLDELWPTRLPKLMEYYKSLESWEWRFGHAPHFTHQVEERLSIGTVQFLFKVQGGVIASVELNTDCLYPAVVEKWAQVLVGKRYEAAGIDSAMAEIADDGVHEAHQEIYRFLKESIF